MSIGFNPDGLGTQTEIVQINGQFFERKTNILSGTVEDTPININLSPTRDPREALNIQKNNEFISQAKKAALYAPIGGGIGVAGAKAIPKIPSMLRGVRDFFVKRKDLQVPPKRVLEEGVVKTIPGAILPGAGGFGLTTPGAVVAGGVGTTGAIVGLDQLVAGETPDVRPIKDIDMTVLEDGAGNITDVVETQPELDADIEPDPEPEPEPEPQPEPEPEPKPKPQPDINPLFDNPNFGMFLRNIGKSLVETGQMGTGLAVGAARAAEERAVVEKQREVAFQELLKEQAKAGAKKVLDPKFKDQVDKEYIDNINKIEDNKASLDFLNEIENILMQDDATGVIAYAKQIGYKFSSLLNPNADIDPKTRVENLLREIAVGKAEAVLGQSSGRLSDRDIILAKQLVADIEGISGAFTSESNITSVLARRRADIEREQARAASDLMRSNILYQEYGLQPPPTAIFDYLSTSSSAANTDIAGEANLGD
tara:strand:- start:105 stop:1550 length:1446 start_codon:yes stop_codon:yes gene_type:complete